MPTKWAGQRRCRQCLAMVARLSAVAAVFRRDASRTRCRTLIPPFPGVTRPAVLSALTAGRLGNGAAPGSRTRLRLDVGRYTRTYLTIDTAAPRRGDPWACLSYERFTRAANSAILDYREPLSLATVIVDEFLFASPKTKSVGGWATAGAQLRRNRSGVCRLHRKLHDPWYAADARRVLPPASLPKMAC